MDLNKLPIFAALTRRLDWLQARQRVLAENIANADTPGYQARDIKPRSFQDLLSAKTSGLRMATTQPSHFQRVNLAMPAKSASDQPAYETSPVGNSVVLEQQLMRVGETQLEHQTIANLYRKHIGLLKTALGRRS
jgi:flagellar basal-body rod protein FlgB